jgi:YD repeat-containing protein
VTPKHYNASLALTQMNRTEFVYDKQNNLVQKIEKYLDPETSTWRSVIVVDNTYDAKDQLTLAKDALGYTGNYGTSYEYDPQGNITKTRTPRDTNMGLSHTQLNTYDGLGRLIESRDANNTLTTYTYNDQGKLLTQTVAGITVLTNTHDLAGNILTQKDAKM